MTAMTEITQLLRRCFREHDIPSESFTLILNFDSALPAARFDAALRREIEKTGYWYPTGDARELTANLAEFRMNGISVRVESPIHEAKQDDYDRAISCLRNARNILEDGGYLYVKDIDKLLAELGVVHAKTSTG
jgi:hypothetical protein